MVPDLLNSESEKRRITMMPEQEERLVKAFEAIATGLEGIAATMEKRLNYECPPERERRDAEVFKVGEQEENQPQTPDEYKGYQGKGPGRFEALFKTSQGS